MASYLGHLSVSSVLGSAYGILGAWAWELDWGPVFLGAGLTAVGGVLPDLDSDSGVPVRELFGVAAGIIPCLLFRRLAALGFSAEQIVVILAGTYLFIRYGVSRVFKRYTVHRGIYHSIPAMFIAGMVVFLSYHGPNLFLRGYLALGTVIGFASHLLLDELCSVDFNGEKVRLNKFAGSAFKLFSPSLTVTLAAYALLCGLCYLAYRDFERAPESGGPRESHLLSIPATVHGSPPQP